MSYDYNALVTSLSSHREGATAAHQAKDSSKYMGQLQEACQVFETLSGHCPMTPLLWLQFAYDMGELLTALSASEEPSEASQQARLQTLELGLNEFPGSAVLQLHYCELLVSSLKQGEETEDQLKAAQQALLNAIQQVGSGSHRHEGEIIAQLYRLNSHFWMHHKKNQDAALASLLQRAKTPMENANDSLMDEVQPLVKQLSVPSKTLQEEFLPTLEEARRWEAKAYSRLRSCEEDVSMAMQQEQISYDSQVDFSPNDATIFSFVTTAPGFVNTVLRASPEKSQRYWMGLGGAATSKAFLQYTAACRKFRFPKDDDENAETDRKKQQQQLVIAVFERGISECPTVESIWLAYLKHVTWISNNDPDNCPSPLTLKTISTRAVRNCPFSLAITQQQMQMSLLLASKDQSDYVVDPDELLQVVNKALDSKFLPSPAQSYDLFLTAIRLVQRRILSLLAPTVVGVDPSKKTKQAEAKLLPFDGAEILPSRKSVKVVNPPSPLDDDSWQEVQDLCEELKDMFSAASDRLKKDHESWTEGRSMLIHEQAWMELIVVSPLLSLANNENGSEISSSDSKDVLGHLEKVVRLHHPSHPDSYKALIDHVLRHGASTAGVKRVPGDVVSRLRQVRGLYQKAIQSVGKGKVKDATAAIQTATATSAMRDYESALSCLCHDYQEFERVFGSEQSLANAIRAMQKKLQKTASFAAKKHPSSAAPAGAPAKGEAAMDVDEGFPPQDNKRKASTTSGDINDMDPPTKRRKTKVNQDSVEANGERKEGAKEKPEAPAANRAPPPVQPKKHHKVKIGHIFHRAHPFTVRISNLALETEEMDIIEAFKQKFKCGPIVHCRIQREKSFQKGKSGASKGWGLLQFEERESVEKALELDQKVELHGNALHLERSHVPAVGLVPPGMHRPKHGKQPEPEQNRGNSESKAGKNKSAQAKPTGNQSGGNAFGVLAFRPRGVGKKAHPKRKLGLPKSDDKPI